jgi:hypothetical protein
VVGSVKYAENLLVHFDVGSGDRRWFLVVVIVAPVWDWDCLMKGCV